MRLFVGIGLLIAIVPLPSRGQPDSFTRVAVLDLVNNANVDDKELEYLSDLVRSSIRRVLPSEDYLLLTRENILELLPDGRTLGDCVGECAIEVGRKLGADLVVTGEVVEFNNELRLSLKLHETKNANLLNSTVIAGGKMVVLEHAIKSESSNLLNPVIFGNANGGNSIIGTDKTPWSPEEKNLKIARFETSPSSAAILIDGQPLPSTTPCKVEIPVGIHQLQVKRKDYHSVIEIINITNDGNNVFSYSLNPQFALVNFKAKKSGVRLRLDGKDIGLTPVNNEKLFPGDHFVQVDDKRYHVVGESFVVNEGDEISIDLELVPRLGAVEILARDSSRSPVEAKVYIDNKFVGHTPLIVTQIIGKYRIFFTTVPTLIEQ